MRIPELHTILSPWLNQLFILFQHNLPALKHYASANKGKYHIWFLNNFVYQSNYVKGLVDIHTKVPLIFTAPQLKSYNDLLGRQTQDTTDRDPFIIQYFPGVEKLRHVLHRLTYVIDDNKHLTKVIPMPPLLIFKQPPNHYRPLLAGNCVQQNIDHNSATATSKRQGCPEAWYIGETIQMLRQQNSLPVGEHFSCQVHSVSDLR
eukprot:g33259.t1